MGQYESNIGSFKNNVIKLTSIEASETHNKFYEFASVVDHIDPIYSEKDNEEGEEDISSYSSNEYSANLRDLIDSDKNSEDASEVSNLSIPSDLLKTIDSDSDTESSGNVNRGIFHYEVKNDLKELSIYSGIAHPIKIDGDMSVGETLRMKDLSQWKNQYPITRVQWFLSTEIGSQRTFQIKALSDTTDLTLTPKHLGHFIQVVVTREIEKQIRDPNIEKGIYDPHVKKVLDIDTGLERQFVPVKSFADIGPILIPNTWAYTFMQSLATGNYTCNIEILDNKTEKNTDDYPVKKSGVAVPGVLTVTFKTLLITFKKEYIEKSLAKTISLWDWILKTLALESKENLTETVQSKELAAHFRLKLVDPRPSKLDTITNLYIYNAENANHEKIICVNSKDSYDRDMCLYHLLIFQAARLYRVMDPQIWNEKLLNGDLDYIKDMLQQYLESLVLNVRQEVPAYELVQN